MIHIHYDFKHFCSNVLLILKYKIVRINHLKENIYIMLENNNVVHNGQILSRWKEVLREFNDLSILFKKDEHMKLMLDTDLKV